MIQKWKCILLNWINCYFNESAKNEENLRQEFLLRIISYLRDSYNLDESKSSILEAHTLEEFLQEKYPDFKFENGTSEARSEKEVVLAASLLLFFVCVNSKEVDIKNAMCSKLSRDDQEIILKFSKSLMECSPILCTDVEAAIIESCGRDTVVASTSCQVAVAETPPALRSLHGEVRRLQAALDAEKFDRAYLQEELARTNSRAEQLSKDKEQYKLEIVNLKARISLCSKHEDEDHKSGNEPDHVAKLTKEMQEIEQQLIHIQGELDDIVYERDMYKSKVEELKKDRDKWMSLSQHEATQATKLAEELEKELQNVASLNEIVNELRMHNKLNRMDSSLLECDDPNISIKSFHNNSSICSEACSNVIELQLGEERAKIVILQEQIQMLQTQIQDLNEKYISEKQTYKTVINERETEVFNLKHRINEEIEEKSNLKAYYDDEVSKLNNDVNELEQRLKGNNENSRSIIERKMQEIKILQEEKLSLLESLTNETTKNKNIIKSLKEEIDSEKRVKANMKDGYENQIMKLNEKILNRNNELVELQNSNLDKSEIIESLCLDLRKEKEMKEEISNKYNNQIQQLNEEKIKMEQCLQQNYNELKEMKIIADQKIVLIDNLQKEMNILKLSLSNMNDEYKLLEDIKKKLLSEVQDRDIKIENIYKDFESLKNLLSEEKEKLTHDLDEKNATNNALKKQLQDEIDYKIGLLNNLTHLQIVNTEFSEKIKVIETDISLWKNTVQKKDDAIKQLEEFVHKEKELNAKLKTDNEKVTELLNKLTEDLKEKNMEMNLIGDKYKKSNKIFQEQLKHKEEIIEITNKKLNGQIADNESLQEKLTLTCNEKSIFEKELVQKTEKILQLETDMETRSRIVVDDKLALEQKLTQINKKYKELEKVFNTETSRMLVKLNKTEKVIKELSAHSKKTIRDKDLQIQKLSLDQEIAMKAIQNIQEITSQVETEKEILVQKLNADVNYKNSLEKEYQNQCLHLNNVTTQLNEEVSKNKDEINDLKTKLSSTLQSVKEKNEEMRKLEEQISKNIQSSRDTEFQKDLQLKELMSKINDFKSVNYELEQVTQTLKKENEQLQSIIEEEYSNHELLLKEKDNIIDSFEQQIKGSTGQLESLKKDYKDLKFSMEKFKLESQEKEEKMSSLMNQTVTLKQGLTTTEKAYNEINEHVKEITKEKDEIELHLKSRLLILQETLSVTEEKYANAVREKNELILQYNEEKVFRKYLETDKNNLLQEKMTIIDDRTKLLDAKANITQELFEERSTSKLLEEEKKNLLKEKISVQDKLAKVLKLKDEVIDKNICLTQQLIEEKSAIELFIKERENLNMEKELIIQKLVAEKENNNVLNEDLKYLTEKQTILTQEHNKLEADKQRLEADFYELNQEYMKLKANNEILDVEFEKLVKKNNESIKEKQSLLQNNVILEQNVTDSIAVSHILLDDKEVLLIEKEKLENSLNKEKSALDEMQNEKDTLRIKIESLNEKHELQLVNKTKEIRYLQINCEEEKLNNTKISTKLSAALDNILQNLKKDNINNEVLQKLMFDNNSDMTSIDKCGILINIADTLTTELSMRRNLALEHENAALDELREMCKQKEIKIIDLQNNVKSLEDSKNEQRLESLKEVEKLSSTVISKVKGIETLQKENESLNNSLNDVKFQLEIKVHSLKEKLTDNENLTDKLKKTYELQIDNLNLMITKLTNYLKDKTTELEAMRKDKDVLQETIENNKQVIKSLEEEININKQNQEKLISDFDSERQVLNSMITVTESVMEDQKIGLNNIITEHVKTNLILQEDNEILRETIKKEKENFVLKLKEKDAVLETILKEISNIKKEKDKIQKCVDTHNQIMIDEVNLLKVELSLKINEIKDLETQYKDNKELQKYKDDVNILEKQNNELKINIDLLEYEKQNRVDELTKLLEEQTIIKNDLNIKLKEKIHDYDDFKEKVKTLEEELNILVIEKSKTELESKTHLERLEGINVQFSLEIANLNKEIEELTKKNEHLVKILEDNETELNNLKRQTKKEEFIDEKTALMNKCSILQDYQTKAEKVLEERQKEIDIFQQEVNRLKTKIDVCEADLFAKDGFISKITREKDEIINAIKKELSEEKAAKEKITASCIENIVIGTGKQENCLQQGREKRNIMKPVLSDEEELLHQVDNTSSDTAFSSINSSKTISDLEKILDSKNRKITTLQSDITHLRSMLAESETQLLDVRGELEMSKENCQQLSSQLKKIVYQKNEEIAELKRQISKMSFTDNRATQIIKVSSKYQAIILKRIAEIKSTTALKELTNFGNTCDEIRRSLPGSITMEDLENFLETTDKHLKRCAEKQVSLQKERDRLSELNKINETEITNLRKYLAEMQVSYQTFSSLKDLYGQRLTRVFSIQRTVRREILNLDGHVTDSCMCKLERSYAAIMQDLSECLMNFERWVERSIARTVTIEKIKQILINHEEQVSQSTSMENSGLEIQIEELEKSFQKVLEEITRATKTERVVDTQAITVSEIRAEYEDKLNRMKAKMNQLYQEQIGVFKEKQREEVALLKRELQKTRDKLAKTSEEYEEHVKRITAELWRVGEKFVVEKAEADGLRRKNRSGSLMSLQHVHSSGLAPTLERAERPSESYSLRSLPSEHNAKRECRQMHMSDEEEVFDNRCLKELRETPRRESIQPTGLGAGVRLSELRWRNSLCPPHLKSSYPAETQFVHALDEDDIKCTGTLPAGKQQRKEVGITAYKKPGPPTPSKQAGRLSATSSELRESLRVEADPQLSRKTSTPSRIRALFRSSRNDTNEGTPRSRRLSNIFRKK